MRKQNILKTWQTLHLESCYFLSTCIQIFKLSIQVYNSTAITVEPWTLIQ
uniref:Uncharacterized protein n=1 Tax=Arundo donax TaxID=35708 RepID=A0A0A9F7M0_ARUDO